jgi:DNA replication protein DnaC
MITETEKQKLIEEVKNKFDVLGLDYQTYDTIAEIDSTLTYAENKEIILQNIKPLIKQDPTAKEIKNISESWSFMESQQQNEYELLTYDNLSKVRTIAIFGDPGSGKTSLAYKILEIFKDKKQVYFMKHPNKKLISKFG